VATIGIRRMEAIDKTNTWSADTNNFERVTVLLKTGSDSVKCDVPDWFSWFIPPIPKRKVAIVKMVRNSPFKMITHTYCVKFIFLPKCSDG
jgi:hypothetical protein